MNPLWRDEAEAQLGARIIELSRLSGGDFAESFAATLSDQRRVFVKTHQQPPPGFFSTEAAGLTWLRASKSVAVPQVLAVSDEPPLLALEWIEQACESHLNSETQLGRSLAALHESDWPVFGRPDGRTTGSQAVPNDVCPDWQTFYASQRLIPLAKIAHDRQALPESSINMLESVASRLGDLGGENEPPSLLHGDLWAGNRLVDSQGTSWLIDPAAHGGQREFDIAMMHLFGGYSEACFQAYNETYPLSPGWRDRIALHQLAPLAVHAIKFEGPYPAALRNALLNYC